MHANRAGDLAVLGATAVLVGLYVVRARLAVGGWEFPLDDAYIYQQFARNLARGAWFEFVPGEGYTPGSTSVLFPFLLVPGYVAGLSPTAMIVYTTVLNGILLTASALLARRMGHALGGPIGAWLSVLLLLGTGSYVCGVLSGLEIGLYTTLVLLAAWLVLEDARATDPRPTRTGILWLVTASLGLGRPEGVLITASVVLVLLARPERRGAFRAWVLWLLTLTPFLAQGLYNLVQVGHFTPNTAQLKSVTAYPRQSIPNLLADVTVHFGKFWKALIMTVNVPQLLPLGFLSAVLALGWLAMQVKKELEQRSTFPACFLVLAILAGIAAGCVATVPGNYYRYYHPTFALISVVSGAALAALWGRVKALADPGRTRLIAGTALLLLGGIIVGQTAGWSRLLAKASQEIRGQQHALADWIDAHLPPDARLMVNDVGAIAYYTRRPIFDYLGLVTNHQAAVFLEGTGALFERLEHLAPGERPGYLAVFPEWLRMPWILGPELFRTEVSEPLVSVQYPAASVYAARWDTLGTGASPSTRLLEGARVVDSLDVADLESESAHRYEIQVPPADRGARFTTLVGVIPRDDAAPAVDGGREVARQERFDLHAGPCRDAGLVARLGSDSGVRISIRVDGDTAATPRIAPGIQELTVPFPNGRACAGTHRVEVRAEGPAPYHAFHYWLWIR